MVKFAVSAEKKVYKGMTIFARGHVYKVVRFTYYDSDGWSFGAMNDEWYDVEAEQIDDTDEGKKLIAERNTQQEKVKTEREKNNAIFKIRRAIMKRENIYNGEIGLGEIPGETLVDTFDIYGGGWIIKKDGDKVWVIMNNGYDGANWSINNVRTCGAGAVGYCGDASLVKKELEVLNG